MVKRGDPITFQAVQREAAVSHAFLYNHPELRKRIEHLRGTRPRPRRPIRGHRQHARHHADPPDRRTQETAPPATQSTPRRTRTSTRREPRPTARTGPPRHPALA
nr:hypothetical protein [Mycolicibacterium frederiksbergense]